MKRLLCCAVALCLAVPMFADQKVKKRMSVGGNGIDSTSYVKGERSRDEMNYGPMSMITIHQCDTHKTIQVNDQARTYMVTVDSDATPAPAAPAAAGRSGAAPKAAAPEQPSGPARQGGTITITTNVTDTGERKQMFGFQARHIKSSMQYEASADACNPGSGKIDTDGWYIDFAEGNHSCIHPERQALQGNPMARGRSSRPDCEDKIRYTGPGLMAMTRMGYPADVTTTVSGKDGQQSFRQEALDISRATLDAALFEPPAGYREVKSYGELMGMPSMAQMMRDAAAGRAQPSRNVSRAPVMTDVVRGAVGTGEVGPKQPGKVRVGVVAVADKTNHSLDGENLRRALISNLTRFNLDAVPANGGGDAELIADCKKKECDYILYTDVATLKDASAAKKAVGGMFGRALGGMGAGSGAANEAAGAFESGTAYRLFRIADTSNPAMQGAGTGKGQAADQSVMPTFDRESRDVMGQVQKDAMTRK